MQPDCKLIAIRPLYSYFTLVNYIGKIIAKLNFCKLESRAAAEFRIAQLRVCPQIFADR